MSDTDVDTRDDEEAPGFEEDVQPNSEAVAEGEAIGEAGGDTSAVSLAQSELLNPYMSEEDQEVEMKPAVVGPPAYGSPDPASQAGRLVPIADHPLSPENAPEGAAAVSEDYGSDLSGVTTNPTTATAPLGPEMTDLERDSSGLGGSEDVPTDDEGNPDYESMTVAQLRDLTAQRGIEGTSGMNKGELVDALEANDEENA